MNRVSFPLASCRLTSKKTALLAVLFKDSCSSQGSVWTLRVSSATASYFFLRLLTRPKSWLTTDIKSDTHHILNCGSPDLFLFVKLCKTNVTKQLIRCIIEIIQRCNEYEVWKRRIILANIYFTGFDLNCIKGHSHLAVELSTSRAYTEKIRFHGA